MTNEIKTAEQRRIDFYGEFDAYLHNIVPFYDREVAELRAKVESLAADAERLEYVIESSYFNNSGKYINVEFNIDSTDGDLRKAIDMAKEKA